MTTPTSPSYVVEEEKSRNDATDQPTIVVPTGLHRSIPYVSGFWVLSSHLASAAHRLPFTRMCVSPPDGAGGASRHSSQLCEGCTLLSRERIDTLCLLGLDRYVGLEDNGITAYGRVQRGRGVFLWVWD